MENERLLHLVGKDDIPGGIVEKCPRCEELLELLAQKNARIEELKEKLKNANKLARSSLSGMYNNHEYFYEQANILASRAKRTGGSLIIFIMDLDRFKEINDSLGHPVGDKVIKKAADLIRSVLRSYDLPFNIGGDEYQILCSYEAHEETTPEEFAIILSKRICETFSSKPLQLTRGVKTFISISVGWIIADLSKPIEEAIAMADREMYKAKAIKKAGRT